MTLPQFTRYQHPTGEIEWTSKRLGEPVAQEENDGTDGARKFRVFHAGVQFLSEKEMDALFVAAGWDLDGSHQRALDENKYEESGGDKPKYSRKPQPKPTAAPTPPAGEPMIPSQAKTFDIGIIQGPPPEEKKD